jgi:hypothetical protein
LLSTPSNPGVALREIEAFIIIIIFLSNQPRSWNGPMGPHPPPQLGELTHDDHLIFPFRILQFRRVEFVLIVRC